MVNLLELALTTVATFVATGLAVLAAFWQEHRSDRRRKDEDARATRERHIELREALVDSLVRNFQGLGRVAEGEWFTKLPSATVSLELGTWQASGTAFFAACRDPAERNNFARFFEDIAKVQALLADMKPSEMTWKGPPSHEEWLSRQIRFTTEVSNAARARGIVLLRAYGTNEQQRAAGLTPSQ